MSKIFGKLDTTFMWMGEEYPCTVTYGSAGIEAEDLGGYFHEASIILTTTTDHFPEDRPVENDLVEVAEATWIIDKNPVVIAGTPLLIFPLSSPDGNDEQPQDLLS